MYLSFFPRTRDLARALETRLHCDREQEGTDRLLRTLSTLQIHIEIQWYCMGYLQNISNPMHTTPSEPSQIHKVCRLPTSPFSRNSSLVPRKPEPRASPSCTTASYSTTPQAHPHPPRYSQPSEPPDSAHHHHPQPSPQ